MTTKLEKPVTIEVRVHHLAYKITLSKVGMPIVQKGKRKGQELTWEQLIRGDVTLAQDLVDSLAVMRASERSR